MANLIRSLMDEKVKVLSGIVEMDQTYIGGKEINKHTNKKSSTGFIDKTPIVGMVLVRYGEYFVKNTKQSTLMNNLPIDINSIIITDELPAYKAIRREKSQKHKTINHTEKEYAKVDILDSVLISTNGIENFWSVFKREIKGTYIRIKIKIFKWILERNFYE